MEFFKINPEVAFVPAFVGTIPAGEYHSEVKAVSMCEDRNGTAFLSVNYEFRSDSGRAFHCRINYYEDSRWWSDFSVVLAGYGFSDVSEIVGLREIVTIAEPANGGRYMEIVERRRDDPRPSLGIQHKRIGAKSQAASVDPPRRKKLFTDDDLEDLDEDFGLDEDDE